MMEIGKLLASEMHRMINLKVKNNIEPRTKNKSKEPEYELKTKDIYMFVTSFYIVFNEKIVSFPLISD